MQIQEIQELSSPELKQKWREHFKCDPPRQTSQDFMRGHIAWNLQAAKHGGLKRKANNQIKELIKQLKEGKDLTPDHNMVIKAGTRLIRQYKGKKYEVIATDEGFIYDGKEYKSLSKVAAEITGTSWNGKVFFGVKRQKR